MKIGQRWPEDEMHRWGSYFGPVPNLQKAGKATAEEPKKVTALRKKKPTVISREDIDYLYKKRLEVQKYLQ